MNWDHFLQAAALIVASGYLGFMWRLGNRVTSLEAAIDYLMHNGIIAQQKNLDERISRIEGRCEIMHNKAP